MLGGYVAYYMSSLYGLNPVYSFLIAMVTIFLLGMIIEEAFIQPLYGKRGWEMNTLLITLGLQIFLQNLALISFGERYKGLPTYFRGRLEMGNIILSYDRVLILIVGISLIVFLLFFIKYTRMGMAMRALSQNREGAFLAGINIRKIFCLAFGLSTSFAAAAGALLAPIYFVCPTVGASPFLMAFAIVILGGLGSIKGAIFAGFLVGVFESIITLTVSSAWKDVFVFALVIMVLSIRPRGFFGIKEE